jgi:hypothetical protein
MKHLEDKEIIWFLLGINIPDKKKRHLMNCNYCKNRAKKLEKSLGLFSNFYPTISESKLHYIGSNIILYKSVIYKREYIIIFFVFF